MSTSIRRAKLLGVLATISLFVCGIGFMIIIYPNNPLVKLFKSNIINLNSDIVIGPYPNEEDFSVLTSNDVKTIVSLLNPEIPYEKILLDREKILAEKNGIVVKNYPMTSILGQSMGEDYKKNALAAADFIASSPDRVYIHCYLGVHRAKAVVDLITQSSKKSLEQLGEKKQRDKRHDPAFKMALKNYNSAKYEDALKILSEITDPDPKSKVLQGWTYYRMNNISEGVKIFNSVILHNPNEKDALNGLGFCALRENRLDDATKLFNMAIKIDSQDSESLHGLGIAFFRKSNHTQAKIFLERALAINSKNEEAKKLLDKIGR